MYGRGKKIKKQAKILGTSVAILAGASSAPGQDAGGLNMSLSFSQQFEYSDNPDFVTDPDSDFRSVTNLRFNLSSVTKRDALIINAGGRLELGDQDNAIEPFVRLSYTRSSRGASLGFDVNYRETDISDSVLTVLNEDLEPELLTVDGGSRQDFDVTARLTLGQESRVGGSISLTFADRSFQNTINPSLLDEETYRGRAGVRFTLNDQVTLNTFYAFSKEDEAGLGTDRDEDSFGVSADVIFSDILTGRFSLNRTEVETTVGAAPTTRTSGTGAQVSLERQLKDGSLRFSVSRDIGSTGNNDTIRLARSMELPNANLTWNIGYNWAGSGNSNPLFGINYSKEFRAARLNVGLSQDVTNSGTTDRINTTFNVSYDQEITEIASLVAGVTVRNIDVLTPTGNDSTRIDFNLTYRRNISRDWALTGGYRYSFLSSDLSSDVESNSIFLGFSRTFSWRP